MLKYYSYRVNLSLLGVLCNMWKVKHQQRLICAVKGSSVIFLCSFQNPDNQTVRRILWGHVQPAALKARLISSSLRTLFTRFQYIGNTYHDCSLKIHQVECSDVGRYFVRFNTMSNRHEENTPVLKVVDLTIFMSKPSVKEAIREGDSVNLTCMNSCDGGKISSAYTWFKNGEPLHEGAALYLRNVSPTSSGNYTCSLKTHLGSTSRVLGIDVEYGPRNTTVLVQPPLGADPGSDFTLICSSHANPPVENYTWFRIAAGDSVNVGHQPVFHPRDSDQYLCSVTNKHGSQNSSVVTLNIKITFLMARCTVLVSFVPFGCCYLEFIFKPFCIGFISSIKAHFLLNIMSPAIGSSITQTTQF
uniref:Ig-like domain-containing protein n=1 Tax=Neolamprologus brichardi TaxID=32507 RepID=A0A3Q4I6T0_NEOBR